MSPAATAAEEGRSGVGHHEPNGQPTMRFAVVGHPNCGKTTVLNRLCGLRAKTANFPGTTVATRIGSLGSNGRRFELVDLPGHYGLDLKRPESTFCRAFLEGGVRGTGRPDAVLIVADATRLTRQLGFVNEALQQKLPAIVALNMMDLARQRGRAIDVTELSRRLGCPVVPVSARTGEGFDKLLEALHTPSLSTADLPDSSNSSEVAQWAERVTQAAVSDLRSSSPQDLTKLTDRLDALFTHPVSGLLIFTAVMTGLFFTVFSLATLPMDLIDVLFTHLGAAASAVMPAGAIHDLVVEGLVPGIAGAVVFLPQIFLLFLLISLLEDTGYLARAVFVVNRMLRRFGLPGEAFVPLLSAHACAIPAIMSARLIPDRRERLATILVAPFMSCSARLPVYVLLIGVLFGGKPLLAGLAFTACYLLGAVVALATAWIARRTILRGPSPPMVLELPSYKLPSLRNALLTTIDRVVVFLRKAGTVIVAICIVLWWLGEYPHVEPPTQAVQMRAEASAIADLDAMQAQLLFDEADSIEGRHFKSRSFLGRMGHAVEPVFAPLGYDWQITIGVLSSFVAREVFVSTMAVVLTGSDAETDAVRARITNARRTDGSPVFTTATAASLLVFYVLAMQCLPTLAVTHRETGQWRWAILQLVYMSAVAYILAGGVYQAMRFLEIA